MKVIIIGTCIWSVAALCVVVAIIYGAVASFRMGTPEEVDRAFMLSFVIGFFPWIFAYAVTRVMYGIETLMEG